MWTTPPDRFSIYCILFFTLVVPIGRVQASRASTTDSLVVVRTVQAAIRRCPNPPLLRAYVNTYGYRRRYSLQQHTHRQRAASLLSEKDIRSLNALPVSDEYSPAVMETEVQWTAQMLDFIFHQTYGENPGLTYRGWKEHIDTARLLQIHESFLEGQALADWLQSMQPATETFRYLRQIQQTWLTGCDSLSPSSRSFQQKALEEALNAERFMQRFGDTLWVRVNIPSALLELRRGEKIWRTRVIVGQADWTTPCFSGYLQTVISFPYWIPPRSILQKEILPKVKKNPGWLVQNDFEVVNARGQVIDAGSINWAEISVHSFPYLLRQFSGCDNALGRMKFDVVSPFSVYLHDTNHPELLQREKRFLSHGCIRVQHPDTLAAEVLQANRNKETYAAFLDALAISEQKRWPLPEAVPLIITYQLFAPDENGLWRFWKDVYHKSEEK